MVVAESDLNDPRLLYPPECGGHGLDAQWADDFHHAVHAFLTGERGGYYADFGEAQHLAKAFERPFVYTWDYSPFRGRKHEASPEGLARRPVRGLYSESRPGGQLAPAATG